MDNRSLSHTKYRCQYHAVFIPKYRKISEKGSVWPDERRRARDYTRVVQA